MISKGVHKMNQFRSLIVTSSLCASISLMGGAPKQLSNAVISGEIQKVIEQLKATPDELNHYDKWGWTPLLWATYYQYTPIVKVLLQNGADPNMRAQLPGTVIRAKATPLIICGYYGTPDIAKLLLAAKADRNLEDAVGETAMTYAVKFHFQEMVDLLKD